MHFASIVSIVLLMHCWCAETSNGSENTPQDVTYCQLVKNTSAFSGKRIRIRAIYSYMFEISRLKSPSCCSEVDVPIWVDFAESRDASSQKLFRKFPKGIGLVLATFEGTMQTGGPYGDGGYRAKFTVDKIENIEAKAKPSPNRKPTWVPRDCEASGPSAGGAPLTALCCRGGLHFANLFFVKGRCASSFLIFP